MSYRTTQVYDWEVACFKTCNCPNLIHQGILNITIYEKLTLLFIYQLSESNLYLSKVLITIFINFMSADTKVIISSA